MVHESTPGREPAALGEVRSNDETVAVNADVEFHIAMTPDELRGARLDKLAKKWA